MELTEQILSAYLPYDVTLVVDHIYEGFECPLVVNNLTNNYKNGMNINQAIEYKAKLKLRELEWLIKPITSDEEEFIPMKRLKTGGTDKEKFYAIEEWDGTNYVCCDNEGHELRFSAKSGFDRRYNCESRQIYAYDLFQKLFEWHFNVLDLPQNLYVTKQ